MTLFVPLTTIWLPPSKTISGLKGHGLSRGSEVVLHGLKSPTGAIGS